MNNIWNDKMGPYSLTSPPVHSFLVTFHGSIIERSIESKKIRDWNLRPKTVSILVTAPTDITFQ